jgi:signal transduction histidine kinase
MAELVDALLDLSRANRAEMKHELVDLTLLAEWVHAELADAEPGRSAHVTVQPGLACMGDERQLKLLLRQLMHNAWRFSGDSAQVVIDVAGQLEDGRLRLSVRDQGIGFDMRYVGKLFEPFQRLHGPEHGTGNGIGLAIAQRVADRHGARLWAESEPGQGSTFHLELTAAPAGC